MICPDYGGVAAHCHGDAKPVAYRRVTRDKPLLLRPRRSAARVDQQRERESREEQQRRTPQHRRHTSFASPPCSCVAWGFRSERYRENAEVYLTRLPCGGREAVYTEIYGGDGAGVVAVAEDEVHHQSNASRLAFALLKRDAIL